MFLTATGENLVGTGDSRSSRSSVDVGGVCEGLIGSDTQKGGRNTPTD